MKQHREYVEDIQLAMMWRHASKWTMRLKRSHRHWRIKHCWMGKPKSWSRSFYRMTERDATAHILWP